ncbi:MAG: adenylate/guanylate cyclase domain-containing protein [Planctomycetes bacterium]|nr:adenylate/guanylate cyclase domain-containing protein [Planctomycetota bacterium]
MAARDSRPGDSKPNRSDPNIPAIKPVSGQMVSLKGIDARVMQIDPEGVVFYMNSLMARSLLIEAAEAEGQHFSDFDKFEWGPGLLALLVKKVGKSGEAIEVTRPWVDPESKATLFYRVAVIPLPANCVQILVQDVTGVRRLREVFERFVSPTIIERMMETPDVDFFQRNRYELTVLFADLRGFTHMCASAEPETVGTVIDAFISAATKVAFENEATIDKVIGDEVMLLFGAPIPQRGHALRAVLTALAMQRAHGRLMAAWAESHLPSLPLGIGVSTGEMVVGCVGSSQVTNYTVLGMPVNLGARLCSIAGPGETLISRRTFEMVKREIERDPSQVEGWSIKFSRGAPVDVKGLDAPVDVIRVAEG